jgi:hypothetical protein
MEALAAQRGNLSDEQLGATLSEIGAGSDRVAAIMGAALVENTLIGALITCLKDHSNLADLFDDLRGPFNTFYAKIKAGRAMGLYNAALEDGFDKVRLIRNKFAHSVLSLDFGDKEVVAWCEKLKPFEDKDGVERAISDARRYYEDGCIHLVCCLLRAITKHHEERARDLERQLAEMSPPPPRNALAELMGLGPFLDNVSAELERGDKNG